MLVDLHIHGMAHGAYKHSEGEIQQFIDHAENNGLKIVGFAEHDWFLEDIDFGLIRRMQEHTPVELRVGVEVDHRPGDRSKDFDKYPFDYLIGSVHEIGSFLFDHPDYVEIYKEWDNDELYAAYFELLEDLIMSGRYDIVGHFDLIKVFGCRPSKSFVPVVTDLLELVRKKGLVVEVNTAGKYKPVGEIYPSQEILRLCLALGVPITLGSDAHLPAHVGRYLAHQAKVLAEIGFKEVVAFKDRKPQVYGLG